LTLVPARPGLVTAVPDSFPAGTSGSTTFSADGGYYGGGLVNFYLNGGLKGTINTSNLTAQQLARQLVESVDGSQLTSPGLYPVSVVSNVTSNLPPFPAAYSNVAVQPTFGNLVTNYNLLGTPSAAPNIPLPGGANSFPSSIVVNSKRKYALVTEEGTDYLRVLDLSGAAPNFTSSVQLICKNAAPCQPTGVAYSDTLHLLAGQDTAVVVNSAGQSLSLVAVSNNSASLISTVDLSGLVPNTFSATPGSTPPLPYAVGVDPATNYAVVAFSNSSLGFIVDLNPADTTQTCFLPSQTSLPCAISSVSLTTGVTPQIVLQPGVPLAYVSPGGNGGVTSVVNLLQKNNQVQIAPASSTTTTGAIRTANVVTIITLTPHGINPATGGSVLITNASPADLNGAYQVNPGSVLDPYTFSYSQTPPAGTTLPDVTNGGGGYVQYGAPYYPFTTSSTSIGDAINPITRTLAFADFNTTISQIILVDGLDQSVSSLSLSVGTCHICTPTQTAPERGFRSVAFDPYTNVLIAFNPDASRNEISLINPGGLAAVGSQAAYRIIPPIPTGQNGNGTFTPATQGATPITVYGTMAYDPQTNLVLAVNAGSGSLTYLNINPDGQFKPVHIESVQVTSGGVPNSQPPLATSSNPTPPLATCNPSTPKVPYSSCFAQSAILGQPATLQVFGKGFQTAANAQVRLDGVTSVTPNGGSAVSITTTVVNDNEVDAAIPAGFFSAPHDYALDVLVGAVSSNVTDLHVVGVQPLPACSSTAAQPEGVAIDDIRHVAVVTNYGCNSISVINLDTTGTLYNMPYGAILGSLGVGKGPIGVAVIPRMGLAVTANNLDGPPGTASIIDISTPTSPSLAVATNVNVGIGPTGVAIDQDRAIALVANSGSVTLSAIDLTVLLPTAVTIKTPSAATVAASGPPTAIAVDPNRAVAVVTNIQNSGTTSVSGGLDVINLAVWPPARSTGTSINSLTANPTGIVYDPAVSPALFYVTSTLQNAIYSFNPDTSSATLARVGTKPYSVAYNYQTGGLISINSTSQTSSIVDTQTFKTRATLGISSQSQFSVAVDNFTNTAVIVDQNNNRVLIMALPK